MSLKLTGQFYDTAMKNDTKLEDKLAYLFKIDMRNLTKFHQSTQKSQKSAL